MILCGIIGRKNAGKTTLTEVLVRDLTARGLRVSTLKRTHHALDLDRPGTDSYRHRLAGAQQVVLASDKRVTVMEEITEPSLDDLIARLSTCDVVLAEGWKAGHHRRIEVWRPECGQPPLAREDRSIAAIASPEDPGLGVPWLDLNTPPTIADFVLA